MNKDNKYLYLIYLVLGFIFLRSSYGKITGGSFVSALPKTLEKFASENPYPFVKDFLTGFAIPNSQIFGFLTMYGELLTGLSLSIGALYFLFNLKSSRIVLILLGFGLFGGAFLNGVFWLSSGWTSSSTDSVNLIMFLVQLIGLMYVLESLSKFKKQ